MASLSKLISRLEKDQSEYVETQEALDKAVCGKVLTALDTICNSDDIPSKIVQSPNKTDVDFTFSNFTVAVRDEVNENEREGNKNWKVIHLTFFPGLIAREGAHTRQAIFDAIHNELGLDTSYQGGHALRVELINDKTFITIKARQ